MDKKEKIEILTKDAEDDKLLSFLAIAFTFILFNGFFYYYLISVVIMKEDWDTKSFKRIKDGNTLNWVLMFTLLTVFNYSVPYFLIYGF